MTCLVGSTTCLSVNLDQIPNWSTPTRNKPKTNIETTAAAKPPIIRTCTCPAPDLISPPCCPDPKAVVVGPTTDFIPVPLGPLTFPGPLTLPLSSAELEVLFNTGATVMVRVTVVCGDTSASDAEPESDADAGGAVVIVNEMGKLYG